MARVTGGLCALCAAALLIAAPADAEKVFHGQSGQGRPVTLSVGDDGRVQSFKIDWRAPCRGRGTYLLDGVRVRPFRRHTTADVFRVDTGYRFRIRGFRVSARIF